MNKAQALINLAKNPSPEARKALANATAEELIGSAREFSFDELQIFDDIFQKLYDFAEADVKARLSSTLAMADWAPPSILQCLANDDIQLARHILSFSPVITEEALLEVARNQTDDHKIALAERDNLPSKVVGALIATESEKVVDLIGRNMTAQISPQDFAKAIEFAKKNGLNIDEMIMRRDLPTQVVKAAYDMASENAKMELYRRMPSSKRLALVREFERAYAQENQPPTVPQKKKANIPINTNNLIKAIEAGNLGKFQALVCQYLDIKPAPLAAMMKTGTIQVCVEVVRAVELDQRFVRALYTLIHGKLVRWTENHYNETQNMWQNLSKEKAREIVSKY